MEDSGAGREDIYRQDLIKAILMKKWYGWVLGPGWGLFRWHVPFENNEKAGISLGESLSI